MDQYWNSIHLWWDTNTGYAKDRDRDRMETNLMQKCGMERADAEAMAQWFLNNFKVTGTLAEISANFEKKEEFSTLGDVYDWIRTDLMAGKEKEELTIDYALVPPGVKYNDYGWNDVDYLGAAYIRELDNLYSDWCRYIKNGKTVVKGVIRDDTFCVYGVPGSGKSRFLMQVHRLLLESDNNVCPILITFSDKCCYTPPTVITKTDFWTEMICRAGFSLFGDNKAPLFDKIRKKLRDGSFSFLSSMSWNIFVSDTIEYMSKIENKNYQGIVLLIDEVLNTGNDMIEMNSEFRDQFRKAWDSGELSRFDLSFIFSTLNCYSWIEHETRLLGRNILTYHLPHFDENATRKEIPNSLSSKNDSIRLLYAATLMNFAPRYLREIMYNFQDDDIISQFNESDRMNQRLLRIGDWAWGRIESQMRPLNESMFNATFTNKMFSFDDYPAGSTKRYCDLVSHGTVVPCRDSTNSFPKRFVPQISLLSILIYLEKKSRKNRLEEKLFGVMENFLTVGDAFSQFHLLFESFRYNAMVSNNENAITFGTLFDGVFFCNTNTPCKRQRVMFDCPKNEFDEKESFDELIVYLDSLDEEERDTYLAQTVVWFGGDKNKQDGFDSLIVYPTTDKNQRIWTFFESRYTCTQPKQTDSMTDINGTKLKKKVINFDGIVETNNKLYPWFDKDFKFLNFCDYKNISQVNLEKKKRQSNYKNVGIWTESVESKHKLTDHFGPTWKHLLVHYIGVHYHETAAITQTISNNSA